MRVAVIGATGHVGSYLVPRLVRAGHDVVAVSRGKSEPYHPDAAWDEVERVHLDRERGEADGTFGESIAELGADAVIDMVCFTPESAQTLVDGLRGRVNLLLSCGTIWIHGPATAVPMKEDEAREPFGDYGVGKDAIERLLLADSARPGGVPSVVLHPGHITGPGWNMINPAGNLDLDVWRRLATGEELVLPDFGLETVHHVHADDVAQAFEAALTTPEAVGQGFHVVSDRALTLRGFATAVAGWFGAEPRLRFEPFERFAEIVGAEHSAATWEHISRSPSASIDKARRVLGYEPRYSSLEAVAEALQWLIAHAEVDVEGRVLAR
ncbi:NAD-dependent epimerase/dehydratase family protein [Leifsonia sp. 21MFCrub1.1]|uniref:NAD-dependent epimerase/dehydratase family protein n=1 Tax=Leifsonia sp. 21MFCrub1.1 TaxID=1798223 RepID=UPI0008928416|nr:NAD-dependent epimerase/dehydratase family protein [Leifsonia sp. 21MFCrub1.1]SEB08731.1 Nucleoside-diphosphate-sugar epimerase [Leifsonia sp. 21MFCrub1.1]